MTLISFSLDSDGNLRFEVITCTAVFCGGKNRFLSAQQNQSRLRVNWLSFVSVWHQSEDFIFGSAEENSAELEHMSAVWVHVDFKQHFISIVYHLVLQILHLFIILTIFWSSNNKLLIWTSFLSINLSFFFRFSFNWFIAWSVKCQEILKTARHKCL